MDEVGREMSLYWLKRYKRFLRYKKFLEEEKRRKRHEVGGQVEVKKAKFLLRKEEVVNNFVQDYCSILVKQGIYPEKSCAMEKLGIPLAEKLLKNPGKHFFIQWDAVREISQPTVVGDLKNNLIQVRYQGYIHSYLSSPRSASSLTHLDHHPPSNVLGHSTDYASYRLKGIANELEKEMKEQLELSQHYHPGILRSTLCGWRSQWNKLLNIVDRHAKAWMHKIISRLIILSLHYMKVIDSKPI